MRSVHAELGAATSSELALWEPLVLVVPFGAVEQHGPHLPLDTDLRIAEALATRLVARCDGVTVAPVVPFGSSGEHAGFAGTLSIGQQALELLVIELGRSLAPPLAAMLALSAHGGNAAPLSRAVEALRAEGRVADAWWPTVTGGDAHAGRTETSLMLAIDSSVVRSERVAPGVTTGIEALMPELERVGVASVSSTGVLGDPTDASAAEGEEIVDVLVTGLVDRVHALRTLARC